MFNYSITKLNTDNFKTKFQEANSTSEALVKILSDKHDVPRDAVRVEKIDNLRYSNDMFLVVGKDYIPHFYRAAVDMTKKRLGKYTGKEKAYSGGRRGEHVLMRMFVEGITYEKLPKGAVPEEMFKEEASRGGSDYDDETLFVRVANPNALEWRMHSCSGNNYSGVAQTVEDVKELINRWKNLG